MIFSLLLLPGNLAERAGCLHECQLMHFLAYVPSCPPLLALKTGAASSPDSPVEILCQLLSLIERHKISGICLCFLHLPYPSIHWKQSCSFKS